MNSWPREVLEQAVPLDSELDNTLKAGLDRILNILEADAVHYFRLPELEDLADELDICASISDLGTILQEVAICLGFQHFTLSVISHGGTIGFHRRLLSSWPRSWLSKYQTERMQLFDPVRSRAQDEKQPFLFGRADFESPLANNYLENLQSHGIGQNGICFPIVKKNAACLSLSFYDSSPVEIFERKINLSFDDLHMIALLATDCFLDLVGINTKLARNPLSDAETRFLYFLATRRDIADAISVTPVYGTNRALQRSIAKALGVESAYQAVAIASVNGWFDDLLITACDIEYALPTLADIDNELLSFESAN